MSRAPLLSGPLDGRTAAARARRFIFVKAAGATTRVYDESGPGRLLYRLDDDLGAYVFAGFTHAVCEKCEQAQPKNETGECALCGARLIPA